MEERDFLQYLCMAPDMYRNHLQGLLAVFGTAKAVCEAPESEFDMWIKTGNRWILRFLEYRRRQAPAEAPERLSRLGLLFCAASDPGFPERLLRIPDCPYGLFYKGRLPDATRPCAAVIGARRCSSYGRAQARRAARVLAGCGVQIISGMAAGIDGIAQEEAVSQGGTSFAVLGSGADVCYPEDHRALYQDLQREGGVISELAPGTPPLAAHFPLRNRIISGLSDAVIVIEAREKSGTLITADYALDQGRDVLAMPGRVTDPVSAGCNRLIAQGAGAILSMDDLPAMLGLSGAPLKKKGAPPALVLSEDEKKVFSSLDVMPTGLEELAAKTGLGFGRLGEILLGLQLKGAVEEISKNMYVIS